MTALLRSILLLTCTLLFSVTLVAQFAFDQSGSAVITAAHFSDDNSPAQQYTVTFNDATGTGVNVNSWQFCTSNTTGCTPNVNANATESIPGSGLEAVFSGNIVTVRTIGSTKPVPNVYHLNLQASLNTGGTPQFSLKIVVRAPLSLVFVLDRSGSMECAPNNPSGWDACTTDSPDKWSMVTDAMALQVTDPTLQYDHNEVPGDLYSIVYFDGVSQPSALLGTNALVNRSTFSNGINGDLTGQLASGQLGRNGTSIGAGLKDAIQQKFSTVSNTRQVVVLITDGVQNRSPLLDASGDQVNDMPVINTRTDAAGEPIEYFCLALDHSGVPNTVPLLLAALADDPNNDEVDNGTGANSGTFLESIINTFYSDNSPQYVDRRAITVERSSVSETFIINKHVSSLNLSVYWQSARAGAFRYRLYQGATDMTRQANIRMNGQAAAISIDFLRHRNLESEGEWRLEIVPVGGGEFETPRRSTGTVNCVVDEQYLDIDYAFSPTPPRVNDRLRSTVQLTINGLPLENADIRVVVRRPGEDAGDLIARTTGIPYRPDLNSEINNAYSVKYQYLQRNRPELLVPLALQQRNGIFTYDGDGKYSADLGVADVSGVYQVEISISAEDPLLGSIRRKTTKSLVVAFARIDDDRSPSKIKSQKDGNFYFHTLQFTPTYSAGAKERLVGPGYSSMFSLASPNGNAQLNDVTDNGDGSYTLQVQSTEPDPEVNIRLWQDNFFNDRPISQFGKATTSTAKWHISAHAGLNQPLDMLDSLYDQAIMYELDLGYRLSDAFHLELVGGYYGFADDFHILGASGQLYLHLRNSYPGASRLGVNVGVGGGYYLPKDEDATLGWNARVVLHQQLSPRLNLGLEGSLFRLSDPDYEWASGAIALRYALGQ